MSEAALTKEMKQRAGHQEILGETLAKFEFFQHGWHPYSRFLDVDKVDLVLRRRVGGKPEYREVQVKYGKLYECVKEWEKPLFSISSWRFFNEKDLTAFAERPHLYLAYVLAPDDGFKGDMFILRAAEFADLIRQSDKLNNGNFRVYISRSRIDPDKWYVRRLPKFSSLTSESVIEFSRHYRNFDCLNE